MKGFKHISDNSELITTGALEPPLPAPLDCTYRSGAAAALRLSEKLLQGIELPARIGEALLLTGTKSLLPISRRKIATF